MSKIRAILVAAAAAATPPTVPKRGEADADFLPRLVKCIGQDISDDAWNALGDPAQDWNNDAAAALKGGKEVPPFPDAVAEAPAAPTRRGRTAAAPAAPAPYEPKENDEVIATSKRGKVVQGFVVEIADGIVIVNPDANGPEADDIELPLASNTFVLADAGDTGAADAGEEPEEGPTDPEVGDTVEVTTKRGKIIVGNVEVIDGDELVIKDAAGTEHELVISALASVKVKVKNSPAAAPAPAASGRRRGAAAPAEPAAATDKPKRSRNEGVNMGDRVRELVCADESMTVEKVAAQLTKEGLQFRDPSVVMIHKDTLKVIKMLRELKKLK